jgi:hypothetical protein
LSAKNCQPGYRDIFLSISACWHLLARQDEAVNTLLASWTDLQIPGLESMDRWRGFIMPKKPAPSEYSFRPELIAAMRAVFLKACEAPQVRDADHGVMEIAAEKILSWRRREGPIRSVSIRVRYTEFPSSGGDAAVGEF